jgi:hypothetical protein
MAVTWMREIQEHGEMHSDFASDMNCEEDVVEMEMWKCLLQVDTEVEVTINPCSLFLFSLVQFIKFCVCVMQRDCPP